MIANKGLLYFVYIIRGWIIWWPVSDSLRPAHFFSEINDDYNPLYKYPFLLTYLLTYLLTVLTYLKDFIYFYPRDAMRMYRGSLREQRVCLTVRLSVTSRYCIKTKKASVVISSPPGRPMILLFWCQILSQILRVSPSGNLKEGRCGKIQRFSSCKRQNLEKRYGQSYYW